MNKSYKQIAAENGINLDEYEGMLTGMADLNARAQKKRYSPENRFNAYIIEPPTKDFYYRTFNKARPIL